MPTIKKRRDEKKRYDNVVMRKLNYLIIFIMLCFCTICFGNDSHVFFRDDFDTIDSWEPLLFPKIKQHSTYTIEKKEAHYYLKAESKASASGLLLKREFDVYQYPHIRWRWRIENVYKKGNAKDKSGDDYPIRIYVIFKYEPARAGILEKIKYNSAKLFYGEYPPHSSLNYIWANRKHTEKVITSPYTERSKMIPLQKGEENVGIWHNEKVNILQDYRFAFGEDPPAIASLAIMNDSDNTKEHAVSYVDDIEIYK
ncbi:MAG: DUF3047 domain-containing protein [Deltaproteobacteria bacterium]|nr:DUF3047 domain-containing protein [Deltaproteobacteria bacterium]